MRDNRGEALFREGVSELGKRLEIRAADRVPPARTQRMRLPEREMLIGSSVGDSDDRLREMGGDELVDLTYADTGRFPPPDWALEEFVRAARTGGHTYTPYRGDAGVRKVVAASVERFLGVTVDAEHELLLTPGTQGGLFAALAATIEVASNVVLADPEYLSTEPMLRFLGASVRHVGLGQPDGVATLDLEQIEHAFSRGARVLVFSNPNNPTGLVHNQSTVRDLARLIRRFDAYVIADELYARLLYDGTNVSHLIAEDGMKERCFTLLGPSKTESMSGFRIGVLVGPARMVDIAEQVLSITALRAPAYAQHTLKSWLKEDFSFVEHRVQEYQVLRDITVEALKGIPGARVNVPKGTSYVFPDVSGLGVPDETIASVLRQQAGVVINPGYQFGPGGVGSFRLCFAQDEEVLRDRLDRIVRTLKALGDGGVGG